MHETAVALRTAVRTEEARTQDARREETRTDPAGACTPFSRPRVGARAAALAGHCPRRPEDAAFAGAITTVSLPI
ncbi:hypothetical protein WDH52_02345 [Streptomyces sp. TRM70308]|uniref:hypothetical protein n=1 Tax=Streptomyces sp. TRM70308 TaxID=3131932 RepID=UPI003D00D997